MPFLLVIFNHIGERDTEAGHQLEQRSCTA